MEVQKTRKSEKKKYKNIHTPPSRFPLSRVARHLLCLRLIISIFLILILLSGLNFNWFHNFCSIGGTNITLFKGASDWRRSNIRDSIHCTTMLNSLDNQIGMVFMFSLQFQHDVRARHFQDDYLRRHFSCPFHPMSLLFSSDAPSTSTCFIINLKIKHQWHHPSSSIQLGSTIWEHHVFKIDWLHPANTIQQHG